MTLYPGSRFGAYEVVALIGAGGMGEVYEGIDTRLRRRVAIKILPAAFAADPDRLARFQREAEVLASLSHPNIAAIHGLEEHDGGKALVMELVEGPTLADRLANGALPPDDALAIATQIAIALEAAHDLGIVHRDLKPANIKVRDDGAVKVLDFGLAKAIEPPAATRSVAVSQSPTITTPAMTQAGMILGTAAYMSPEQARGRAIDRRTDIWAFGCVLFEMLTGGRAFEGEDVTETLAAVVKSSPSWERLPKLPPLIALFLRQSLEKDWKNRLGDIREMRLALSGGMALDAVAPAAAVGGASTWAKVGAVLGVAVIGAALAGAAVWPWRSPETAGLTRFEYVLPQAHGLPTLARRVVAISSDGRTFLYHTRAGLYVRSMGDLEARLLPGTDAASDPFLSPDGEWVGFFDQRDLRKVPIAGGPAVTLCKTSSVPYGASWGADPTIVFAQAEGIMRVSANGGNPELIVRAEAGETVHRPQLMPGGDAVLFSVTTTQGNIRWDSASIVVYSLSSSRRTVVVKDATDGVYLPSGHLVYAKRDGLFGVAFSPRALATSGGTVALVQGVQAPSGIAAAGVNFDVSSTGTLVYLARRVEQRAVVWLSRRGDTVTPVTTIPPGTYEDPRLSPDGGRLLMTLDGDVWVFDLPSGRTTRVTRDGGSLMGVWDPSGTRIAYSSGRTSGAVEAWVAPADGSGAPQQLTHLGGTVHVDSWSPDGKLLTMHHHPASQPTLMHTLAMDRADAQPMPFPVGDFAAEGLDFAANGRHAVFVSTASGRREIYIRPYPGPGQQVIVSVNGGFEPVWAANGDIFYRGLKGDQLFVVPVTAAQAWPRVGEPVLLSSRPFYMAPTGSPRPQFDVTADGQRVVMLSPTTISGDRERIVVVQNWFDELKRRMPAN